MAEDSFDKLCRRDIQLLKKRVVKDAKSCNEHAERCYRNADNAWEYPGAEEKAEAYLDIASGLIERREILLEIDSLCDSIIEKLDKLSKNG